MGLGVEGEFGDRSMDLLLDVAGAQSRRDRLACMWREIAKILEVGYKMNKRALLSCSSISAGKQLLRQ